MLNNIVDIDQGSLKTFMKFTVKTGGNLLVFGSSGIGKTEMAIQACAEEGYEYKYLNLSVKEAPDLSGLPMIDEVSRRTTYALPDDFPRAGEKEVILLVDEIDKARPELQNPMLELLQFRSIAGTKLAFKAVLATANLPDEGAHSQLLSHALTNRCKIFRVTHSYECWRDWAVKNTVSPLIVGFLSRNMNLLLAPAPKGDDTAYCHPSPRAWSYASKDLLTAKEASLEFQELLVASYVGKGAAAKFKTWLECDREIAGDIDSLIKDGTYPSAKVTERLDRLFVCAISATSAVADKARAGAPKKELKKVTENVFGWLKKLPDDVTMAAYKSSFDKDMIQKTSIVDIPIFNEIVERVLKSADGK